MDEKKLDDKRLDEEQGQAVAQTTILSHGLPVFPQPTADPLDPLNWSSVHKNSILAIVCLKYFLFTEQYAISYSQVNWTVAIPALGLAVGPLIWSSFADIYGRRIVFIIGTVMALAATIGAAAAPNYGGYMAARFFQGLGVSPGATVGLACISDMFFEHERGQKVGIWVLAIDSGLLVGPILGGFLNVVSAAWIQWFTAILFGVLLILELAFMPETLYPRHRMLIDAPVSGHNGLSGRGMEKTRTQGTDASVSELPRTKKLPFVNVVRPVPGMRHPKPWDSVIRFALTFKFLAVVVAVLSYCFLWYWWVLSVITMLPAAYLDYTPLIQGLLFIGLLLGTLFAEICLGGRLSDNLVARLAKQNGGQRLPEQRLWLAYPGGILTAVGLIVWGVSIDRAYHWMVGQVAFFLFAAGIQMGNTVVVSYIVDAYPLQSMAMVTYYAVFLNLSAFINPFFIAPWQASVGWTWCFATQGIIVAFGALPVIAALQKFGPSMRQSNGAPIFLNPEHDSAM
ncbi:hypothetical protein LTR51_000076 [Lithohypha guttulata]|nr:hypothetical protein LTR51_000076 [Lithohypha guttulata]